MAKVDRSKWPYPQFDGISPDIREGIWEAWCDTLRSDRIHKRATLVYVAKETYPHLSEKTVQDYVSVLLKVWSDDPKVDLYKAYQGWYGWRALEGEEEAA